MVKVARYCGIKVIQSNNTLMISGTPLSINAKWAAVKFAKKYGYELDSEPEKKEFPTLHFIVKIKPKVDPPAIIRPDPEAYGPHHPDLW